jgi:glyoxylase-like metal-dependent hydrolase (beta-lactamase superfamily II)
MDLAELAPNVYACLQEDRGLGCSNSGLVRRGGGLVVDTFWDLPHTREMIATYARVTSDPVRRVVNTHHNGDHCWGNQLFAGAEIIGHRACAAAFGRDAPPAVLQGMRAFTASSDPALATFATALAPWDFTGIELTPPTTLLDDRLELDLDGIRVELRYVGPAHTAGDVIVHLPNERIVFTGDVLFHRCTPIGWEGTYDGWIAALDQVIALAPEIVVPGHGPLCGIEGPREMKAYLEYVRGESRRFFAAGLSALDAAKRLDLGPYAGWTEPERLLFNVERAYRELRGEPFDAPIDVMAMFRGMHELRGALRPTRG